VTAPLHLLVAERDGSIASDVRAVTGTDSSIRLLSAASATDAVALARQVKPELVLVGPGIAGLNPLALCQSLHVLDELKDASLVLVVDARSPLGEVAAAQAGAEFVLSRPFDPGALRMLLKTIRQKQQIAAERQAAELVIRELHRQLGDTSRLLESLLVRVIESRRPGAVERCRRLEEMALKLAARFGVPEEHVTELARAARLAELGEVVTPVDALHGNGQESRWARGRTAALLLAELPGLHTTAELVEAVHENWDGTGHPDHRQQGQIPLRSRILRLVTDFFEELDRAGNPSTVAALARLQDHAGTSYDPMTLVHLKAILEGADDGDLRGRSVRVPVDDLRAGMTLSEDLVTDSGLKLLAGGTMLTLETLEVIRRRHALEPIVNGAAIRRRADAA
jgi:response regulator RpfG family c-di-GMP phosphodiesterase